MPSLQDIVISAFMVLVALALVGYIIQAVWRVLKATWGCFALAALWLVALIIAGAVATDTEVALGLASLAVLIALGAWQHFIGIGGPSTREREQRKRDADNIRPVYQHTRTSGLRRYLPQLIEAQQGRCGICGRLLPDPPTGNTVHVDHILPVSRGGADHISNLQATHATCNLSKGAG